MGKFLIAFLGLLYAQAWAVQPAPPFMVSGKFDQYSLKRFKGKVVYVDFWASWCKPCKKSFPWMNRMHQKYLDSGLRIVAINVDWDRQKAENFLKLIPAQFAVAFDPKGKVAEKFQIKGMPASFLIDRRGNIISNHVGFTRSIGAHLEEGIRKALNIKKKITAPQTVQVKPMSKRVSDKQAQAGMGEPVRKSGDKKPLNSEKPGQTPR